MRNAPVVKCFHVGLLVDRAIRLFMYAAFAILFVCRGRETNSPPIPQPPRYKTNILAVR